MYTLNMEVLFSIDAGIELWIDADKLEDEQIYEPYILIVPEEYDDKKIINVHIEDDYVREIEFPEGCQYISISNCANLESVVCSSSIYELTVSNCENLKSFAFPEDCYLPEISLSFLNIASLESLDLPDTVMWIDNSFWNLNTLSELILPDGLQTIRSSFISCPSLETVDVPDSVTLIDGESFTGCDNLTFIVGHDTAAEEYAIENDIPYQYRDE